MKPTRKPLATLLALLPLLTQAACGAQLHLDPEPQELALPAPSQSYAVSAVAQVQTEPPTQSRAGFAQVQFAYPHSRCTYPYSPTDFCDTTHRNAYARALESAPANFANGLVLLDIPARPEFHQKSLVVLDPDSGIVWPLPFDAYAGRLDTHGNPTGEGTLEFSSDSSTVCIDGSLLTYRVIETGHFCFTFNGGRFEGHITQYMLETDN